MSTVGGLENKHFVQPHTLRHALPEPVQDANIPIYPDMYCSNGNWGYATSVAVIQDVRRAAWTPPWDALQTSGLERFSCGGYNGLHLI